MTERTNTHVRQKNHPSLASDQLLVTVTQHPPQLRWHIAGRKLNSRHMGGMTSKDLSTVIARSFSWIFGSLVAW